MITLNGQQFGTATEIAQALGADITIDMIRKWAQRDGLTRYRDQTGHVHYALDQAAAIERTKRASRKGRPRRGRKTT